ncbi:hypothetical protein DAEQUDRAFT_506908 [Daedalea quercina L-15889]|uniref:Uncharacterized protein n=1 Tax=Daedalea quercina L-15889 TaxID=1314783 RepID=A0A165T9C0_9APHY|nr:hypothetical protein DAEQUDRAFT_506908 [Daedalea quercina L-15889]
MASVCWYHLASEAQRACRSRDGAAPGYNPRTHPSSRTRPAEVTTVHRHITARCCGSWYAPWILLQPRRLRSPRSTRRETLIVRPTYN